MEKWREINIYGIHGPRTAVVMENGIRTKYEHLLAALVENTVSPRICFWWQEGSELYSKKIHLSRVEEFELVDPPTLLDYYDYRFETFDDIPNTR